MKNAQETLFDVLESFATLQPTAPAVISKEGMIGYGELMRRVTRLSAWLGDRGIAREIPVAVCADRSSAWVVAALGVLYAGGMYVPIDPLAPLQRKIRMLEDAGVRLLLAEPYLAIGLPDFIEIAPLRTDCPTPDSAKKRPGVMPSQAAYGIYTSGSTGIPKNVIVPHESLENYAATLRRELMLTSADRYLHTASLAFSASIRQLVAPLVSGAAMVIATQEETRDPESLVSRMVQTGVTVFDTVPSHLLSWLEVVCESPRDWRERLAASLRLVMTTGEPLLANTVKSLQSVFPQVRILNLYGQTETTGTVALYEVERDGSDPVPIGRALDPCRFYVLDEQLNPVDEGELCVSGPCLASGYQGQPDLTATRFCPDPFNMTAGAKMYRTGDRVRRLENGFLEFKGRKDNQVKIHGIRIDLGEIDAVLLKHVDVKEVATVLRPVKTQDLRIVAFVVRRLGSAYASVEDLRTFLATSLCEAMLPAFIEFVDELPRTESGKIDRPALLIRDIAPVKPNASSPAPRTSMERLIAKCWEEVLQLDGLSVDDDFFALGGDSLQAITMTSRLQGMLLVKAPLTALFFQDPSLRAFANAIEMELEDNALAPQFQLTD
jgi:amino acid adenylation domain-containing protein